MMIELDKWYTDYKQEAFLELIKKYPLVPFFVEDSCSIKHGDILRWNKGTLQVENKNNDWQPVTLDHVADEGNLITFVVFKSVYTVCSDEVADKVALYIGNVSE